MKVNDSARLSYELITKGDAELLFKLDQNPEVMRFINGGQQTSMKEIVDVFIPRVKKFTNPALGWGLWKVTVKTDQSFIGWILIRPMEFFTPNPELDNLEIGWRFMQSSWGHGYATEAALAVKAIVEQHDNVKKISAIADEKNIASLLVMKKIGLSYVKNHLYKGPMGDMQVVYYQKVLA
jgi:RimJ/RimL family protein N-acetyltransferase